jgi:hypothetical protein
LEKLERTAQLNRGKKRIIITRVEKPQKDE